MPWAQLDDGFHDHRKVVALLEHDDGLKALGLWTLMVTWAARHTATDGPDRAGIIPRGIPRRLAMSDVGHLVGELLKLLCDEGLLEAQNDGSHRLHEFFGWQQLHVRQAQSEAGKRTAMMRWGGAKAQVDSSPRRSSSSSPTKSSASSTNSSTYDGASSPPLHSTPQPMKVKNTRSAGAFTSDFTAFWDVYPRRTGKGAAAKAFDRALQRAELNLIMAGATRYRDDPGRDPQYTKHPSTWLNQDCWTDDPIPVRGAKPPQAELPWWET